MYQMYKLFKSRIKLYGVYCYTHSILQLDPSLANTTVGTTRKASFLLTQWISSSFRNASKLSLCTSFQEPRNFSAAIMCLQFSAHYSSLQVTTVIFHNLTSYCNICTKVDFYLNRLLSLSDNFAYKVKRCFHILCSVTNFEGIN